MILNDIAEGVARTSRTVQSALIDPLSGPVLRIGVTGLARAGKTVFITSLVANLLERGRMQALAGEAEGRILAVYLAPQPDDAVPRFEFERHLDAMTGAAPHWPASTRAVSQIRLSIRARSGGPLSGLSGPRTLHVDIVDYPGEWLLDLALLEQDFARWSAGVLEAARAPGHLRHARPFLAAIDALDPTAAFDEGRGRELARLYTDYLAAARAEGLSLLTPGRFLMPGEMEGSPALTFTPLPPGAAPARSFSREFARRYDAYRRVVVRPFFRDHFARIDRQVVLLDVLSAVHAGPRALGDMQAAMAGVLAAFRPGRNTWLGSILGRRVERILFAATKADHLHHGQHPRLTALTEGLVRAAVQRATFSGAATRAMSIASVRATAEQSVRGVDLVRGVLAADGREVALHAGDLPAEPARLLSAATRGEERWLDGDFDVMSFAPPEHSLRTGEGPPHIRLDHAADFLLGDRL